VKQLKVASIIRLGSEAVDFVTSSGPKKLAVEFGTAVDVLFLHIVLITLNVNNMHIYAKGVQVQCRLLCSHFFVT
jgi:hypothetical protein